MKNGEQLIYPINIGTNEQKLGLTKREYFAGLAMQGLLASAEKNNFGEITYKTSIIKDAIRLTDELLKQLENK